MKTRAWPRPRRCPVVGIAQLVRAPDCGSGGRGFETPYPPHFLIVLSGFSLTIRGSCQVFPFFPLILI
jgi:hypothetical protein